MVLGKSMIKLNSILLMSVFIMSSLGYGPISVWAQESSNYPLAGMQNANSLPSGINPCFGQGNHTETHHFGQGNFTRTHHFGQGNFARNGMHPCLSPTPNQSRSGSNIPPQASITTAGTSAQTVPIPSWVKNNAKWWSAGTIDDSTFAQGIQYMVQQKIVKIPTTHSQASVGVKIPQWVRNDASYWSSNQIDDSTFIGAIQYLVQSGIVSP